jgi:ABC-type branched-subunit amino acid transport system substrate-binding protein
MTTVFARKRTFGALLTVAVLVTACSSAATPTPSAAPSAAPASAAPASAAPGSAAPSAAAKCTPDKTGDINLTHLNYYTGPWADVGPWFKGITDFPLSLINQDPPLGRKIVVFDADIGTVGEAAITKKGIEKGEAEIVFNIAHGYLAYRDWMLAQIKANDSPILPSVNGGAIPAAIGGTPEEPLMRGAPQDSGQASAAMLYASEQGAKKVAVVATEVAGSQLQKEAALSAAKELGMEVLIAVDIQSTQPDYRAVIQRIAGTNPDAVIIFSQAQDGGTFVKQAAEAGQKWEIIGTTEWMGEAFPASATMDAINQHKAVLISGFSYAPGPAWDYFKTEFEKYAPTVDALKTMSAENSYAQQFYDSLTTTALAIEKACSTSASKWVPALREVTMAPGTKCYNYNECVALIRAGTDVDYVGPTGEVDYTATGVVSGTYGIFTWKDLKTLEQVATVDATKVLEIESKFVPALQ